MYVCVIKVLRIIAVSTIERGDDNLVYQWKRFAINQRRASLTL